MSLTDADLSIIDEALSFVKSQHEADPVVDQDVTMGSFKEEVEKHAGTYEEAAKAAITEAERDIGKTKVNYVRYLSTSNQSGVRGRTVGVEVRRKSDKKVIARVRLDVDPSKWIHFIKDNMQGSQAFVVIQDQPQFRDAEQRFLGYVDGLEQIAPKGLTDEQAGETLWQAWGGKINK